MSAYRVEEGDVLAKVEGQTVHCERAHFYATPSVPIDTAGRLMFGMIIGFGFTTGVCAAFLLGAIVRAAVKMVISA